MEVALVTISVVLVAIFAYGAGWFGHEAKHKPKRNARGQFVR